MDLRRCLICFAVVGTCLHTAASEPFDSPHVDPPQPHQYAIPTLTGESVDSRSNLVVPDDGDPDIVRQLMRRPTMVVPQLHLTSSFSGQNVAG